MLLLFSFFFSSSSSPLFSLLFFLTWAILTGQIILVSSLVLDNPASQRLKTISNRQINVTKLTIYKERKFMKITYSEPEKNAVASTSANETVMHRFQQIRLIYRLLTGLEPTGTWWCKQSWGGNSYDNILSNQNLSLCFFYGMKPVLRRGW